MGLEKSSVYLFSNNIATWHFQSHFSNYSYRFLVRYVGPKLPVKKHSGIHGAKIVTSPNGKGVVLIGGTGNEAGLLELTGNSIHSLKWVSLEQKLMYPRNYHVVFPIPDENVT